MYKLLPFALIISFCGCTKPVSWKEYDIRKGDHYCGIHYGTLTSQVLRFEANFSSSCIYCGNTDINKLYGFSECDEYHHKNSARFGWRWDTTHISIWAYYYNSGVFHSKLLGYCGVNESRQYQIRILENYYQYSFSGSEVVVPRDHRCDLGLYYRLWPYFGGTQTAPHDMKIYIQDED